MCVCFFLSIEPPHLSLRLFRRRSAGRQLVLRQRAGGGLPERPVGGGVRLALDGQRRQCGLQAAGPEVGENSDPLVLYKYLYNSGKVHDYK